MIRVLMHYLLKPLRNRLYKQLPKMSETEQAAIDAGDTWWEKELFGGSPQWEKLFAMPLHRLSQEEQDFLNHQVEHLCSLINDWEIVHHLHELPEAVWAYLKTEKFFGLIIPKQYGGLGFSALAHSAIITKIASQSISVAVTSMVPNSLGPAELLLHYGTEDQKNYYLPRLATGEEIPCFALTGPDAGSDAGAITDTGIVCKGEYQGQTCLGIRLNWDKRYITLAPIATVLGLAVHVYDPSHLLGEKEDIGISLCLIPRKHPGVEMGLRHYPMHLAFMNGPTRGRDVFIPLDWIIGGVSKAGEGWKMLMACLSVGRSISLPALSTACAKSAYRYTGAYATIRRQFNSSLAEFEGVKEALGDIAGYTYLIEATRLMTAYAIDEKINPAIVSAIAKYHMTEMCRKVLNHAMDVHGGQAIQMGPRNVLASLYIAMPISITVEGANILTRNLIIFGQGAIRCHPFILKEMSLLQSNPVDERELDAVLGQHIWFFIRRLIKSFFYGITGAKLIAVSNQSGFLKKYLQQLTRMSTALSILTDASLAILGGSLKRRERISARLGDILSHLYLASAALKYFKDQGALAVEEAYIKWSLQFVLYQIQLSINQICNNFPHKVLGKILRFIIFPWGHAYAPPSDQLHHSLVSSMVAPSAFRDRLTEHFYQSKDELAFGNRLEKALQSLPQMQILWKKMYEAKKKRKNLLHQDFNSQVTCLEHEGVITREEAERLREFEALRVEIIRVNEFSFELKEVLI